MSRQVKKKCDPIADGIEHGLDTAHRVVDHLLWPLKPIDSVIHGTARGVRNWLCDEHPADNAAKPKTTKKKKKKLAVDSSSSDDDSDGSGSPPPCKGKGGHHNVDKFGNVKKNHANGVGNNNNVNGKLAAKMGNQKLHSSSSSDDDSSDEEDSDGSESPPPCKGKGKGKGKGGHHNVGKFGNVKNNHANGAGNNNNVNGKLDAKMGNQKLHRKK